jgi:hypothetical protein
LLQYVFCTKQYNSTIITVRHNANKISYMDSLEQSYIQLHNCNNYLIYEEYIGDCNPFFDLDCYL